VLLSGWISSTEVDTYNCPFEKDVLEDLQYLDKGIDLPIRIFHG
jgi:hypothetical protein